MTKKVPYDVTKTKGKQFNNFLASSNIKELNFD